VSTPAEHAATVRERIRAEFCDTPMRGIYGADSTCARPKGHTGDHDSVWNHADWGWPELAALVALAERATERPGVEVLPDGTEIDWKGDATYAVEQMQAWREKAEQAAERAANELTRWIEWSDGNYPDDSPGDVISADPDGTIVLDDGITTWNPKRASAWFAERANELEHDNRNLRDLYSAADSVAAELERRRNDAERDYVTARDAGRYLEEELEAAEARANELQGRVTVLEGMRSDNYIEALESAEARAEQLERERDEWKREAELSKWPKDAAQEYHRLKVDLPAAEARAERLTEQYEISHRRAMDYASELDRERERAEQLETALREIVSLPDQSEDWHEGDVAVTIARAALDGGTA